MITSSQCRAGRSLAGQSQEDLAKAANVGLSTIRNFEAGRSTPVTNNLNAIIAALEAQGVQFLDNGDIAAGLGVALKGNGEG